MRTRRETIISIAPLLITVLLLTGCTGNQCEVDADCGGVNCSNNLQTISSSSCVEGKCVTETTDCEPYEICVQDSLGVKCLPKDPDTGTPIISCSGNTINPLILSFNPTNFICSDDCPADAFCGADCICLQKEELRCSENTLDTENFGTNLFDVTTNICADDCPIGYGCGGDCLCEEHDCPEFEFTANYFDPPPIDMSLPDIIETWLEGPDSLEDWLGGEIINISAYMHDRDGVWHIIPFPEEQLILVPNPNNDYILQYGAYCVNDYYEGDQALTIEYLWLFRPEETCIWGGTTGFEGVLTVCTEILIDWLEAYTQ